ncbi:MAG: hypothetical protein NVS2B14_03450 [Chamaesiphon sp.]
MPLESYRDLNRSSELPKLKVIGLSQQSHQYWSEIYHAVSHSPVKVFEIDLQDPVKLIIKTELGKVYLGSYSSRLAEQLGVLDRMRELPTYLDPDQIDSINLKNPDSPSIQMKKNNSSAEAHSHEQHK